MYVVNFFRAVDGESDVAGFLRELQPKARAKCQTYMERLKGGPPLPASHATHVEGEIFELRPEWGGTEYRFLYARCKEREYVILLALKKKKQRLRPEDIDKAKRRLAEHRSRCDF